MPVHMSKIYSYISLFTDEPDPPQNVFVRCYDQERRAEIEWQPGRENFAPILNYIIQFNTTFAAVSHLVISTIFCTNPKLHDTV